MSPSHPSPSPHWIPPAYPQLTKKNSVFTAPRTVPETLRFLGANRFLQALDQAGILADVDSRTAITVLAPNDAAFRRDTAGMSSPQVASVLRNHVLVSTTAYTPLIQSGQVYATLSGGSITTSTRDDVVSFGGARVAASDAIIKNGVVDTINKVSDSGHVHIVVFA